VVKKFPVIFTYPQYSKGPSLGKCVFVIRYSTANTPPKRVDKTVFELCRIECDIPFEEWKVVGDQGWRRCDVILAMTFEGEPKWKVRVGLNQVERDVNVEYYGD
jgi:hypothetical protein